jgi:NTP pyrophosphatase (non-canonical NTP hydrolase)
MNIDEFIKLAERTASSELKNDVDPEILHGCIGVITEAGELFDVVKKHLFYGQPFDMDNFVEELGDLYWYLGMLHRATGIPPREVFSDNINKLERRYPEKYTDFHAKERLDKNEPK